MRFLIKILPFFSLISICNNEPMKLSHELSVPILTKKTYIYTNRGRLKYLRINKTEESLIFKIENIGTTFRVLNFDHDGTTGFLCVSVTVCVKNCE